MMSQNGQTYFKNLAAFAATFYSVSILGHYALKVKYNMVDSPFILI